MSHGLVALTGCRKLLFSKLGFKIFDSLFFGSMLASGGNTNGLSLIFATVGECGPVMLRVNVVPVRFDDACNSVRFDDGSSVLFANVQSERFAIGKSGLRDACDFGSFRVCKVGSSTKVGS